MRAIAIGVFLLLLGSSNAHAYCRTTTCGAGQEGARCEPARLDDCGATISWQRGCIGFALQSDGSTQASYNAVREQLTAAFDQWVNAACGNGSPRIRVDDLGAVDCAGVEYNQDGGNVNVVVFRERNWPHQDKDDALALTTVTYDVDTREIVDADIEINGTVLLVDQGAESIWYDLQGILTHEAGHFLGLAHTAAPSATMIPAIGPLDTQFRDLESDDVSGICSIYPPGAPVRGDCNPIPKHGFSDQCVDTQTHGDCRVAAPGERDGDPLPLSLLALAFAAACVQRRRP